ncbi:hypothetical protein H310_12725 [Aphanomyces invadans]|uniref:Peptidase M14 domain-containing protein n=1 Tax=Aphanomyces invadans TaxID=157072 RepID=A0A024TIX2_9STRA|nr:hypothetical protein H310_12725 [Aphanomyces invadans]ETV93297.1 hypothetical protein H310_12725 [Aphanomyces invadans]|eukprot:XP_008878132.1 hypothetical protein H310_12725 [Aphanomyces invadans]
MKSIVALVSTVFATAAAANANETASLLRGPDNVLRTVDQIQAIQDDADVNRKCHTANSDYIASLKPGSYATSMFHNCFRTTGQIFEFVDKLTAQNPMLLTREAIATTVKGKTIYAYKLTNGNPKPKSLYYQSLLHAREWISGSSNVFTLASILDDVYNKKPTALDTYNLYFVPVANIDGYDITWSGNRNQRKNANQVDLNRNWPSFYKNPRPPAPSAEDYPGPFPFSEPETKGIGSWLKAKNTEIAGWVDIHSYGGLIMYPYGDTLSPIGGGEDEKFQRLGRSIASVAGGNYKAQTSARLYPAYGCFDDYHYRTFKKPVLTIEVYGTDFVAATSTIRTRGSEMYRALTQFAKEVVVYNGGIQKTTVDDPVGAVNVPYLAGASDNSAIQVPYQVGDVVIN